MTRSVARTESFARRVFPAITNFCASSAGIIAGRAKPAGSGTAVEESAAIRPASWIWIWTRPCHTSTPPTTCLHDTK